MDIINTSFTNPIWFPEERVLPWVKDINVLLAQKNADYSAIYSTLKENSGALFHYGLEKKKVYDAIEKRFREIEHLSTPEHTRGGGAGSQLTKKNPSSPISE